MRSIALLSCIALVAACSPAEKAADTTAAMAAPPPAPPAMTMADLTGTWNMKGMNEKGDSTLVTYTLNAMADTSKWTFKFTNAKKAEKIHLMGMGGDSMMFKSEKFPSQLRKGVMVWNEGTLHMKDGMLKGMTTAHYSVKTADSVRVLQIEGTRAPAAAK
jgi:hypothetical protein